MLSLHPTRALHTTRCAWWIRRAAPLLALLLVTATWLRVRALDAPVELWNFSYTYAASQCFADGCNPYDADALNRNAARRGWPLEVPVTRDSAQYPPSTLLLAGPLGELAWPAAKIIYQALALLLLAAALAVWLRIAATRRGLGLGCALLLAALAGRAFPQAMEAGNLALPAAACLLLCCCLLLKGEDVRSHASGATGALLLALALMLKPQLALGALVLLLLKRESRTWAAAALLAFSLELGVASAVLAARLGGFAYLRTLAQLTSFASSRGQMLDPSPANPVAATFLDLPALLLEWRAIDARAAHALTLGLIALLCTLCWWLARVHRSRPQDGLLRQRPWTLLALAALLTLLPVYHRQYDRVLVLLVLPAAFEFAGRKLPWRALLVLLSVGWMAWEPLLERLQPHPPRLAWSVLFELALSILLLASLYRLGRARLTDEPGAPDLIAS